MRDIFEDPNLAAWWESRPVRSYVVRLGYYPRGCWITGTRVTRPTESVTVYVRARDVDGMARAATTWAARIHRYRPDKLLVDHWRYMAPEDASWT